MKTKKCLIFLIATICLTMSMTSCGQVSDDDMIANCVENFFDAINEGDMDEALTYVDSRSQKIGGMAISLIDSFIDTELISGIGISDIMGVSMALGTNGNMFTVDDIDIIYESENQAIANCTVSVEDPESKEVSEETVPIYMMYDDEWLIDLSEEFSN